MLPPLSLRARRLTRVDRLRPQLLHDRVPLAALQELVARLPQDVAGDGLGAVGGEPGRVVTGGAPAARVERRAPVGDPQHGYPCVLRSREGLAIERCRGEQDTRLDARLPEMTEQRLHLDAADGRVLASAGNQDAPAPGRPAHRAFELEEVP